MALLATQIIGPSGVADTLAAAAGGGDTFTPDKDTFIRVNNGSGAPITVTITVPAKYRGLTVTNLSISVTNATSKMIGPFPADSFADPTTGVASIGYSSATSVTVGAFKLGEY